MRCSAPSPFLDEASRLCGGAQAISQLRGNQKLRLRGREWSLTDYFRAYPGVPLRLRVRVRGGEIIEAVAGSARLHAGQKAFRHRPEVSGRVRIPLPGGYGPELAHVGHSSNLYPKMAGRGFLRGLEAL